MEYFYSTELYLSKESEHALWLDTACFTPAAADDKTEEPQRIFGYFRSVVCMYSKFAVDSLPFK